MSTEIVGPMGTKIEVEGPWYTLVRDIVPEFSVWRLLNSAETESEAREAATSYADSVAHDVQWEIGEVRECRPGGVIILGLPSGAVSDVKICQECAIVIGQGKSWQQVVGKNKCAGCDAELI